MRLLALLAALALALAACSGGEPPPAPAATPEAPPTAEAPSTPVATPEAPSAAEAPSTPAPTAEATPVPAPAPAVAATPEAACANGVAVEDPEDRPGLVDDCVLLLASRDALRGEASLDWGGDLAIGRWEGVAVEGEPPRVVRLDLSSKGLTGSIPRTLRRLRLDEVRLAGNALTGCVPSAFGDARGDALYLGLPWCLRYDRLDATGEVAEAGGWAILDGNGAVITTWEGLRSEAATLRVHQTDAGGTSWAAGFGAVSEGDLFEWRKASDCWVRYLVTGPPVRPSAGSGRWEFPVEWMTYAATGEGCTGAVGSATVLSVDEAAPGAIPAAAILAPIRHGAYLVYPRNWAGAREPKQDYEPPPAATDGGAGGASAASAPAGVYTYDLNEARRSISRWRDPALPAGWTFKWAESWNGRDYEAVYQNELGYDGVDIHVYYNVQRPSYFEAGGGWVVYEPRVLGGHAAIVVYSPQGWAHERLLATSVWLFDADTGIEYQLDGVDRNMLGSNIEPLIEIALSLLQPAPPQ